MTMESKAATPAPIADYEALFVEWLTDHRGIVVKVAKSFTADAQDRDDLIQEILIRIWASIGQYRGESKVSTFMYRVALNRALTWKRDESKRRSRLDTSAVFAAEPSVSNTEDEIRLNELYRQIRRLSEIERSLILLSLDGFTYAEMAEVTGTTETNIGARLTRARTKLATFIGEYQHD